MTSDERIAKALEALARIAQDIKNELRADRDVQARRSNRGLLNLNTMTQLKTASGRLVGYGFPNEKITVHETTPSGSAIPPLEEIDLEYNKVARLPNELNEHVLRPVEDAKAKLNNRPNVMDVLERWRTIDAPMNIEVVNVHSANGDVVFYGHINGQPLPGWQIQGIIKDVY